MEHDWTEVERLHGYVRSIEDNEWGIIPFYKGEILVGEWFFPRQRLEEYDLFYPGAAFQYIVYSKGEDVKSEIVPDPPVPPDAPWIERMQEFDLEGLRKYLESEAEKNFPESLGCYVAESKEADT